MRKLLCAVLIVMILSAAVPALALDEDLSKYTDAQLQSALDYGEAYLEELKKTIQQTEELIEKIKAYKGS